MSIKELSYKQKKAIFLLVHSNRTNKEVAKQLSITEQTLYNWLNRNEEFTRELNKERIQFSQNLVKGFKSIWLEITQLSLNTLANILKGSNDNKLKVSVAKEIVKTFRFPEMIDEKLEEEKIPDTQELLKQFQRIKNAARFRSPGTNSQF